MKNSNVKYSGIIVAIVGVAILTVLGYNYARCHFYNIPEIDMADYTVHTIIGAIMLIGGILTYIFVDE